MIDLHEEDKIVNRYADRYHHYLPVSTRVQHNDNERIININLNAWDEKIDSIIPEDDACDKAVGALVGLAIGDAVGTTLEFLPRDKKNITDMVGGGPFRLNAGEWTDDTSMALCLAETYLQKGTMDTSFFRDKLVRWYYYGENSSNGKCFDIGNTTRYALEQYLSQGPSWFGNTAKNTAGNAALIRMAPVPLFRRHSLKKIYFESKAQSRATHGAVESIFSCQFLGFIINYLIKGYSKEKVFSPHTLPLSARVLIINAGEYKQKTRDQIRSSGYVIDTLEAAMWAVWNTDNFRDAILLAANLGDDADSVAATAGQIAGALYGYSGIPQEWRDRLVQEKRIAAMAEALFRQAPEEII
ncbi:ADP-ribosylarginine hydrolase Tri1 [Mixta calida]|uniref:ADP-ribosylarginine hydrolase Tri1 n=1 Tax=Mixta calida TaxID=665913 RepID=UPI00289D49E9|nr:ADP-ribosylarginine hydrolase Tri1 [Mixta calida]